MVSYKVIKGPVLSGTEGFPGMQDFQVLEPGQT